MLLQPLPGSLEGGGGGDGCTSPTPIEMILSHLIFSRFLHADSVKVYTRLTYKLVCMCVCVYVCLCFFCVCVQVCDCGCVGVSV